jgi:spore maturation protein CgeB
LNPDVLAKIELPQMTTAKMSAQTRRLKILAVSPIYGGSVPAFRYSVDALKDLGHRVEVLDNTPYVDMLLGIEDLTKSENHRQSLRALLSTFLAECSVAKAMEMRADMVFAVAQSPMVPDALREFKQLNIPTAFWFVEDRFLFPYWKEYASLYDYFFVIQRGEFLEELQRMGVKNACYLPCAAHPPIHRPVEVSPYEQEIYGSDISFMGAGYYNRHQMFMKLLDFDFKIWGQDWNLASPLGRIVQNKSERIAPEDYIKVYNASKINLNLHSSPTHEGVNPHGDFVNPRTFELAACGAFQLVDHRSELPELFDIGKEMVTFKDASDLREKIKYYLDHPDERNAVTERARERVLAEHTYTHRMEAMLAQIAAQEPTFQSSAVSANSAAALAQQAGIDTELGQFLAKFDAEEELTLDSISEEIRKGSGELSHTEGIFLLMKEFQDWAREKGVINN